MPVYDYKCKDHGLFFELSTMDEAHLPKPCPQCQSLAARVICVSPDLLDMPKEKKQAFAVNEKAQNEPVYSTVDRREQDHEHKNGCGCNHKKRGRLLLYTAQGDKMFPSARPWMISH
jgi:putative FmdB family regulatory protein